VARLPPPTALARAQAWLRQSTNAELAAYIRFVGRQGRLDTRHVAEIERELSEERLSQSRNNALIEWIEPEAARAGGRNQTNKAKRLARPYAHPYFWAGFIHTGL
jgi:CHAT domain-containing protein